MKISLKALRVNAGFTLSEASKKLNISRVTLASYESKKTKPNIEMLNKMLELYNAKFSNFECLDNEKELIIKYSREN